MNTVRRLICACLCSLLYFVSACTGEQADQAATAISDNNRPDIIATNAFYYYHDVEAAWIFYRDTLGLETLVTDELNRWHEYAVQQGMQIEYDATSGDASLGDSFVTFDAEGYRLRFVRYNPHPNHISFVESFANATPVSSTASGPGDMSIRATVFSVYYKDVENIQSFFEELFDVTSAGVLNGVPLYQLASSGFVSLENYSGVLPASPAENGVNLSFLTTDVDAWFDRASAWPGFELRTPEVLDESGLVRVFVGYDPTGISSNGIRFSTSRKIARCLTTYTNQDSSRCPTGWVRTR